MRDISSTNEQAVPQPTAQPTAEPTLRDILGGVQTEWSNHIVKMPDMMWHWLQQLAMEQGRKANPPRPQSVNSVVLGIILDRIELEAKQ